MGSVVADSWVQGGENGDYCCRWWEFVCCGWVDCGVDDCGLRLATLSADGERRVDCDGDVGGDRWNEYGTVCSGWWVEGIK